MDSTLYEMCTVSYFARPGGPAACACTVNGSTGSTPQVVGYSPASPVLGASCSRSLRHLCIPITSFMLPRVSKGRRPKPLDTKAPPPAWRRGDEGLGAWHPPPHRSVLPYYSVLLLHILRHLIGQPLEFLRYGGTAAWARRYSSMGAAERRRGGTAARRSRAGCSRQQKQSATRQQQQSRRR